MTTFREFLASRMRLAMCVALSALGVSLLAAHTGHVLYALPYVLLLACPLMHCFGDGHGHGHRQDRT